MGYLINFLKKLIESSSNASIFYLRIAGTILTITVVIISGFFGWIIEQLYVTNYLSLPEFIPPIILIFALSSCLAAKSLKQRSLEVINALDDNLSEESLLLAKEKLRNIVGREVEHLDREGILRATAESASENSVDGIFAPLFWMMIGSILWEVSTFLPGPLALAWAFKASSTIDSMIGYKFGNLRWIGESGAKLDDILTFIPCRLVVITLPLISNNLIKAGSLINKAYKDGSKDLSPNSGLSESIFAYCAKIRMGGVNIYKGKSIYKPIIAGREPLAKYQSINRIFIFSLRLEIFWILLFTLLKFTFQSIIIS